MSNITFGSAYGDAHRAHRARSDAGEGFVAFDMRSRSAGALQASHAALVAQLDGQESLSYDVRRDADGEVWITFTDTRSGQRSAFLVSDAQLSAFQTALSGTAYAFGGQDAASAGAQGGGAAKQGHDAGATDTKTGASATPQTTDQETNKATPPQPANDTKAVGDELEVALNGGLYKTGYMKGAPLRPDFSQVGGQVTLDIASLMHAGLTLQNVIQRRGTDGIDYFYYTYQKKMDKIFSCVGMRLLMREAV